MIHWLFQPAAEMPAELRLLSSLSEEERVALARYTVPKRRGDWLLGRWTAKTLIQRYLREQADDDVSLDRILIQADPDGAPFASLAHEHGATRRLERLPISLSISHSHGHALCALCAEPGATVGTDLEFIEARDPSFTADFFTPAEQSAVAAAPEHLRAAYVTVLWSAKEAVLKALRAGLRVDTRQVEIVPPAALTEEWSPLGVALSAELAERYPGAWSGWGQCRDRFVLTMALRELVVDR
jgi:4'-phosphopantetheinyl transferase